MTRTRLDVLQTQHALFDRILDDQALHKYVLFLSETMDAIIGLRLGGIVPREVHAKLSWLIQNKVQSPSTHEGRTHLMTRFALVRFNPTPPHLVLIKMTLGP